MQTCSIVLNSVGLFFDIIGAFILWKFDVSLFEEDEANDAIMPADAAAVKRNRKLSRMGILFLMIGFGFQLLSQLCQFFC